MAAGDVWGVDLIDGSLGELPAGFPMLVSGPEGSGRTTLAIQLADATLRRGGRVVFVTSHPPELILARAASMELDWQTELKMDQLMLFGLEAPPEIGAVAYARLLRDRLDATCERPSLVLYDGLGPLEARIDPLELEACVETVFSYGGPTARRVAFLDLEAAPPSRFRRALDRIAGASLRLEGTASSRQVVIEYHRFGPTVPPTRPYEISPVGLVPVGQPIEIIPAAPERTDLTSNPSAREPRRQPPSEPTNVVLPTPATRQPDEAPQHAAPVSAAPEKAAPEKAAPESAGERVRTVLVITNESNNWRSLSGSLAAWFAMDFANSGEQGLQTIAADHDAVIVDAASVGAESEDLLTSLRDHGIPGPLIAVTDRHRRSFDRVLTLLRGADDLLPWPPETGKLRQRLESAILAKAEGGSRVDRAMGELLPRVTGWRLLDEGSFLELVRRGNRLSAELNLSSSVLSIVASELELVSPLIEVIEEELRDSDVLHLVDGGRVLVYLPLTAPDDLKPVLQRLSDGLRRVDIEPLAFQISAHAGDETCRSKLASTLGLSAERPEDADFPEVHGAADEDADFPGVHGAPDEDADFPEVHVARDEDPDFPEVHGGDEDADLPTAMEFEEDDE